MTLPRPSDASTRAPAPASWAEEQGARGAAELERWGYVDPRRLARLDRLLAEVLPTNAFQRGRLGPARPIRSPADFAALPFSDKKALVATAREAPPFGRNLTFPHARYVRYHQTSGTSGAPLPVLDTAESWAWWGRCWAAVFEACGVGPEDRLFFAFSFGPFIGFWAAWEGAQQRGALCLPGGGASSSQRLRMLVDAGATVLLGTPSYALHLGDVAAREGIDLRASAVRLLIVAGEVGGSVPATRARLSELWGADVIDHAGASEVGAWGIGCADGSGLCVNEAELIAEVVDLETGGHVEPGSGRTGELVLTNLGRAGFPVVRYRTGDLVRPARGPGPLGPASLVLEGGVLGRCDDMVTIRGINVFPSAIEEIVRAAAGGAEFRVTATRRGALDELELEVEGDEASARRVAEALRVRLGLRIEVRAVSIGTLPRWEVKARRFSRKTAEERSE